MGIEKLIDILTLLVRQAKADRFTGKCVLEINFFNGGLCRIVKSVEEVLKQ